MRSDANVRLVFGNAEGTPTAPSGWRPPIQNNSGRPHRPADPSVAGSRSDNPGEIEVPATLLARAHEVIE
jgi:hypothetical protein